MQLRSIYKGREEEGGPFVQWRLASADERGVQTLDDYIDGWMERDRLRHNLLAWMKDFPLIVAPVGSTNAVPHDTLKIEIDGQTINAFKAFSYSQTLNVFDLPALTVRAGQSANGMPMGVQIIGRPFAELEVLSAAAILEKALGGWQPPPAT
jgi:amidase